MKYKDNWEQAAERWTALWKREGAERPCMCVTAPNGKQDPVPPPQSGYQKYMDPDYIIHAMLARFECAHFGGESFPTAFLNAGWVTETYGAEPVFKPDTIWFDPIEINWEDPPVFELDLNNKWFLAYRELHQRVLEQAGKNGFMMGGLCVLPGHDFLSLLLGTQEFLMDLIDRPEWMKQTIMSMGDNYVSMKKYFHALSSETNDFWYGAGWTGFWAPEPFVCTQSDVSCMLSPDMFSEFIVPELDLAGGLYGCVWYHLDGPDALRHLPVLLSLDYIRVIQWVPGAGAAPNGPAWMETYKQIQKAGRIVDISMESCFVEDVVKQLDPSLLCIHTHCANIRETADLIESTRTWCKV